VVWGVINIPHM